MESKKEPSNFQARVPADLKRELNDFLDSLGAPNRAEALRSMRDLAEARLAEERKDDLTPYLETVRAAVDSVLGQFSAISVLYEERCKSYQMDLIKHAQTEKQEQERLQELLNEGEETKGMLIDELAARDKSIEGLTEELRLLQEENQKQQQDHQAALTEHERIVYDLRQEIDKQEREKNDALKQANSALSMAQQAQQELKKVQGLSDENARLMERLQTAEKDHDKEIKRLMEIIESERQRKPEITQEAFFSNTGDTANKSKNK